MSGKRYKKAAAKKSQKTTFQSISEYALQMLVAGYAFLMLCIYPLYYDLGEHGRYFNMGATKYAFFKWTSIVGLSVILLAFVAYLLAYRKDKHVMAEQQRFSGTDYFAAAFLAVSMLSYIFSSYQETALWGYKGWFMGVMSQLFFVAIFFFISRAWKWSPFTLILMVVTAGICYIIGILQRLGYDPMGMYERVGAEDIEKFLSTLGQTSWYSSYAVLILPFGFYFYWSAEKRWTRAAAGIFSALGFGMLCTTNSDSAYVAVLLIMMVFFRYSLESNAKMRRFLEIGLIALASFRLIGWTQAVIAILRRKAAAGSFPASFVPMREATYITGDEKLTKFITASPVMLAALICFMGIYAAFRIATMEGASKDGKKEVFDIAKHREWIWRWTVRAAILAVWAVLFLMILVTTGKVQLGGEESFLYFGVEWGNHRGFNWRMAARAITNASFKDLLIGVGPDCFDGAMDTYCAAEVSEYWHGLSLACAHNEWLNMLVTEGVLGVAAYLGIFLTMFKRACRSVAEEPALIPFMGAIVAYIGHNVFCYQQCECTTTIFILMGMAEMICRAVEKDTSSALRAPVSPPGSVRAKQAPLAPSALKGKARRSVVKGKAR